MSRAETVRAATRDASWYRRPSTHGKDLVSHVVRAEVHNEEGACGVPVVAFEGLHPMLDLTLDAASVLPANRCQRPGCKARWPDYHPAPGATPERSAVQRGRR